MNTRRAGLVHTLEVHEYELEKQLEKLAKVVNDDLGVKKVIKVYSEELLKTKEMIKILKEASVLDISGTSILAKQKAEKEQQ
jgi:cobyrinic acid a,c-diamide synthase